MILQDSVDEVVFWLGIFELEFDLNTESSEDEILEISFLLFESELEVDKKCFWDFESFGRVFDVEDSVTFVTSSHG